MVNMKKLGLVQRIKENIFVAHRRAGGVLLAGLVLGLALTPGPADRSVSAATDEVDNYIETELRQLHIPGISLAVVRNGQVIKAKGYGLADLELNVPATKETVYEIGSMTKKLSQNWASEVG